MAVASDITIVRQNVGELMNRDPYTDADIALLIDNSGVTGATVAIWERKAASVANLVNVSEAGASHSASDLFAHYEKMLAHWKGLRAVETTGSVGPRVKKIVRL